MSDTAMGFVLQGYFFSWGTTLAEVVELVFPMQQTELSARFAGQEMWGLEVLSTSLYAFAFDRPVWQAWYELSINEQMVEQLTAVWGPPDQSQEYVISHPAGQVRQTLGWEKGDVYVGLSLFAQPRPHPAGVSAAALTLHWENDLKAAQPYLPIYQTQDRWLASQAITPVVIAKIILEEEQRPFFVTNYRKQTIAQVMADASLRQAQRALYKRALQSTPAGVAQQLTNREVLVWRNPSETFWAISTVWETVVFQTEPLVQATLINVLPAKGGGGAYFSIGELTLQSGPNSAGLTQLIEVLQQEHLIKLSYQEEYDY